ncbi:MAG: glycoside hydrolase family 75 protein [Luteolibacter sp.]
MNVRKSEKRKGFPWFGVGFLILTAAFVGLLFTDYPAKVGRKLKEIAREIAKTREPQVAAVDESALEQQVEQRLRAQYEEELEMQLAEMRGKQESKEKPSEKEVPPPEVTLPLGKVTDVRELRSGIPFKTEVTFEKGGIASKERVDEGSYVAKYELTLRLPAPAKTLEEIAKGNPDIATILPSLPQLLEKAEVSRWYNEIYNNKAQRVKRDANALNELLTKHNIYDCQTILNLRSASGRRVFFMQAEMDVVADGSDGDRLAEMPESIVNSTYYQPTTSYGWRKVGKTPNPMIAGLEKRIVNGTKELNAAGTTADRKKWLNERISMLKRLIQDLKARSYLIAEYDPFIVIPVNLLTASSDSYAPKVGDYAVVIYGKKVYPCIVGDGGPTFKVGEASLRMAKELNAKSTPYNRPVSDLTVTYVVFPGSREAKAGPPDYDAWRQKCHTLLGEIGGLGNGYELHQWTDLLPKPDGEQPPGEVPVSAPE